tara:strand:+ start:411 stop:581 length:171 start_codon:yes stop_codon:yes gene_type:complete
LGGNDLGLDCIGLISSQDFNKRRNTSNRDAFEKGKKIFLIIEKSLNINSKESKQIN